MNQRQCHSQGRRQAVSIVLLGLLTLSSGCIDVRTRLIKTETIEHVSGRFPDGPPTVSIQPHPDNLGWAVSLQQPARIETAQSKQELWEYTQYQFMPPSMIVGVVQCPIVTGLWVVTLGTFGGDSIRDACMRVLMFEPHAKGEQLGVAQPTGVRTEPTSLPVSDGAIRLRWLQEKGPEVSTPLGSDGTAQVRLHRLTDQLSRTDLAQQALLDQSAEGIIIHGTETLTTWPITPGQLRTARQQLPATSLPGNSWPQTIRVTVEEPTGGTRESRLQWKTWLQEYFERRRLVANPAEAALANVQDEQGNRETVRTQDPASTPATRNVGPTIIVKTALDLHGPEIGITVTLTDSERRIQLASSHADTRGVPAEVAWVAIHGDLDDILRMITPTKGG